MRILDLGPLWIESAGVSRPIGGRRLAAVLSLLLAHEGRFVSADQLIDAVWGRQPPPRPAAALDTLLWRLRRALEPERAARSASAALTGGGQGYRLTLDIEAVDSWSFGRTAARLSAESHPLADRLDRSAAALARWRGEPYENAPDTDGVSAARARLAEQRLTVQLVRADALLEAGRPEQAVAEVVGMQVTDPFAEGLWARRILGLRQAGRVAAAGAALRECSELFHRELGVLPGPEILAAVEQAAVEVQTGRPVVAPEFRVPRRRGTLVGRRDEAEVVIDRLAGHRQLSLIGPVGSGKTRLAVEVAHLRRNDHRDGVFFVDLAGVLDPSAVAGRVQQALALPDEGLIGPARLVGDYLASRQVLLILDNCEQVTAATAALVEAFLDECPLVSILLTSRHPVGVAGELVHLVRPLPMPAGSDVASLTDSPAAVLLVERLAVSGGVTSFTAAERADLVRICAATDGLPLSLELAAALHPVLQLHEIAAHLRANPGGLRPRHRRLRESRDEATLLDAIEHGHRLLTEQEQLVHRRLAVLPPEFTLDAATAVCADDLLSGDEIPQTVAGLTYRSLLDALGPDRESGPSRFRQLVPIRAHALQRLRATDEQAAAVARRDRWVRSLITSGPRPGRPGQAAHYRLLADNHRVVAASVEELLAADPSDEDVFAVAALLPYWIDRMIAADPVRITTALVAGITDANSILARRVAVITRGAVLAANQRAADGHAETAVAVSELVRAGSAGLGPEHGHRVADLLIIAACCFWVGDDYELATAIARAAGNLGEEQGDTDMRLLAALFECLQLLWEQPAHAAAMAEDLAAQSPPPGNDLARLIASVVCSLAALFDGDGPAGLRWTATALRLQGRLGVRNIADTLETRGNHYMSAGRPVEALRCYAAARLRQTRLGRTWPHHPGTPDRLAAARAGLPAAEVRRAWAAGERLAASDLVDGWL